mgnify:CR=1 FL=1
MKNFKNNSYTKKKDLKIYEKRIRSVNLTWVSQVLNILEPMLSKKKLSLNDYGCNVFQLYKGIKKRKLNGKLLYTGYDHDKHYISLGLKYFPELKKKFRVLDLEKIAPKKSDIGVMSATLEHMINPDKALDKILNSTRKLIIIRTFLGKKKIKKLFSDKKFVDNPYFINQFSFNWLKNKLIKRKFKNIEILKDKATKGKVRSIYPGLKRKFSIVVAKKV